MFKTELQQNRVERFNELIIHVINLFAIRPVDRHYVMLMFKAKAANRNIVTLENNDSQYWLEVGTPQALVSYMEERKKNFVEPLYSFIVVRELTLPVIKEAVEAFLIEQEDCFWFKLYYSMPYLTNNDLDFIINRHKKEMQADLEED